MSQLERAVSTLHSSVMQEFMRGKCSEVEASLVKQCVKGVLEELGFEIKDFRMFTLDGQETESIEDARYLRVEATHEMSGDIIHVFTFALMKHRDKFKVLYLQSAVKVRE